MLPRLATHVLAALLVAATARAAFDPALMREDGVIGSFGVDPGSTGFEAFDLDGAGPRDLLVAETDLWYVLHWDLPPRSWQQRAFHDHDPAWSPGGGTIAAARAGDVDGDGVPEIVVLLSSGFVEAWDLRRDARTSLTDLGLTGIVDMELAEVDGAPEDEIVVLSAGGVSVFRAGVAAPLWSVAGVTGVDVAAGFVDADPAAEIVVAGSGAVIDCATHAVESTDASGFGQFIDVADVDRDGIDEIAFVRSMGDTGVIDFDLGVEKWRVTRSVVPLGLRCRDTTGDGTPELIVTALGVVPWGHDGVTGDFTAPTPGMDTWDTDPIIRLEVAPLDAACALATAAILVNARDSRGLVIVDSLQASADFRSAAWGAVHSWALGDLDADGDAEIVLASGAGSDCNVGAARVVDRDEGIDVDVSARGFSGITGDDIRGMSLVQADADPQLEYVAMLRSDCGSDDDSIVFRDGLDHASDERLTDPWITVILARDLSGDGVADLLHGTSGEAGSFGPRIFASRGSGMTWFWATPDLSVDPAAAVADIHVADADGDGDDDVLATVTGEGLHVMEASSGAARWDLADPLALAVDVADVVPGGAPEILLGESDGTLVGHDGASHAEIFRQPLGVGGIGAITSADIDGDGTLEIVVAAFAAGMTPPSVVLVVSPIDRSVLWTSRLIAGEIGVGDSLKIVDSDEDGRLEIAVGGAHGISFFEHGDAPPDVIAPEGVATLSTRSLPTGTCCESISLEWTPARDESGEPVAYEIHRSTTAGFTPDASTLVATTTGHAYRDDGVVANATYEHAIGVRDAAGNASPSFARALTTGGPSSAPLVQPRIVSVTDLDPCSLGLEVVFEPATTGPETMTTFTWTGVVVMPGVTSPLQFTPPFGGAGFGELWAARTDCGASSMSDLFFATDADAILLAPSVTWFFDDDPCLVSGFKLQFSPATFSGVGHHVLLKDGIPFADPATSPVDIPALDGDVHEWTVVAVNETCGRSLAGPPATHADASRPLAAPIVTGVIDVDPCAASAFRIEFAHSFGASSGRYELWVDGALHVAPLVAGQLYRLADDRLHAFVVRAIDETCGVIQDSAPWQARDSATCLGDPLEVSIRLARESTGADALSWLPPFGSVAGYDAYIGSLASLWTSRAYDHAKTWPGVTHPRAPIDTEGCLAARAGEASLRVDGLPAGTYVLLVAVAPDGSAGPFGPRSDGLDRHDPAVDPRPATEFCR